LEALAALPADATPRRRLEAAVEAHLLSSLEHSDYTSASIKAFSSVPDAVRRNNRDHRRAYEDIWRQLFVELKEAGVIPPDLSLDALRLMILGSMNWAGEWYRPGRLTIASIARNFAAAVLRD
jgi:TetR/AcrR family transcriptional regulator, cholesterol catabolism regulator